MNLTQTILITLVCVGWAQTAKATELPPIGKPPEDALKICGRPASTGKQDDLTIVTWIPEPSIIITALATKEATIGFIVEKETEEGLTLPEVKRILDAASPLPWRDTSTTRSQKKIWETETLFATSGIAPLPNSIANQKSEVGQRWVALFSKKDWNMEKTVYAFNQREDKHINTIFGKTAQKMQAGFIETLKNTNTDRPTKITVTESTIEISTPRKTTEEDIAYLKNTVAAILGGIELVLTYTKAINIQIGSERFQINTAQARTLKSEVETGKTDIEDAVIILIQER